MKKIILGLLALALIVPVMSMAESGSGSGGGKNVDWACVSTATDTREDAILAAFNTFSSSMVSALTARGTSLTAANAMTDKDARKTARKSAWETFKQAKRDAEKKYKMDRKSAWDTFRKSVKDTCKAAEAASEEKESSSADPVL